VKRLALLLALLTGCAGAGTSIRRGDSIPPMRIQNGGVNLPIRFKINCTGALTCSDDSSNALTTFSATGTSLGNFTLSGNNLDLTGAGAIGIGNGTATSVAFKPATLTLAANTIATAGASATNTTGLRFNSNVADGSSSIGIYFNNSTTLSNTTSRLLRLDNNGTQVLGFYPDGTISNAAGHGSGANVVISDSLGVKITYGASGMSYIQDSANHTMAGVTANNTRLILSTVGVKFTRNPYSNSTAGTCTETEAAFTDTSSARTYTLPSPSTCGNGWTVFVCDDAGGAASHNIACAQNASETINGSASTLTACVKVNNSCTMCRSDGTNWRCMVQ